MTLREAAQRLAWREVVAPRNPDHRVRGGYASDLLSDVMAHAREGDVWFTIQTHQNVTAVACLTGVAAVIFTGGAQPDVDTVEKAGREGLALYSTSRFTYEAVGQLYLLLSRESDEAVSG
ncbi:MAG: hypothetical protein AB1331_04660 [Bacillota bacterium]